MSQGLPHDRPLLQAATLCEKILFEQDNTISAIRMVDRFFVPEGAPPGLPLNVNLLVCFKAGPYRGSFDVTFRLRRPSGAIKEVAQKFKASFEGTGADGSNFMMTIGVGLEERGLHYFEVLRGEEILAMIPFTLANMPEATGGPSAEADAGKPA